MAAEPAAVRLDVVVAIDQGARQVDECVVSLAAGATLGDALRAMGLQPDADAGIWGRARPGDTALEAGDRVEVYRGLRVDPKTARRERFRQQGGLATGRFARKS